MSEKPTEVAARLATAHQLEAVVTAMRGVAAARANEAQAQLAGIRAAAATVGAAIGDALAIVAPEPGREKGVPAFPRGRRIVIVLSAEQGFVGAFNEQIVERAAHCAIAPMPRREFLVAGTRGAMLAEQSGLPVAWSTATVARAGDVPHLARRITDALYERLDSAPATPMTEVSLVHAMPSFASHLEIVEHELLPFDYGRFETAPRALPPLHTLPSMRLLTGLAQWYVFVELCEAAMLSFAAENEARVRAMTAARSKIETKIDDLSRDYRLARQDEITSDILELATGTLCTE
jgi:F-type H+-transporting ATPase subunit gamma